MSHVMNTYSRLPVAFERGEGVWLWDNAGQALPRRARRHCRVRPRPQPPAAVTAIARTGRQARSTPPTSTGSRCRNSSPTGSPRSPAWTSVLLQLGLRGQRGGDQARAALRPPEGHRVAGHHRAGKGLPRPHDRHAVGHRQPQGAGRLRAAGRRVSCACRSTISKRCSSVAENNRNVVAVLVELIQGEGGINICHDGYLHGLREICDAQRLAADARRSAERHRPHRQMVRLPAFRRQARRDDARQGARHRRADRRLPRRRPRGRACSSPATTARPSAAIRSPAPPRSRRSPSSRTKA